jgi:hypothetical protein
MSYLDRVKGEIKLTSPDGDIYTPKWTGNNREITKKLGIFSSPNINGSKAQDLGVSADLWPLTLFFDGEDHDLTSEKFAKSLKQKGVWKIVHPTKGDLELQLVTASEAIQPVSSGGVTQWDTQWIEPIKEGVAISSQQLAEAVKNGSLLSDISAAFEFVGDTAQNLRKEIAAISTSASRYITAVRTTLRTIENFEIVPAEFEALLRGIDSTINSVPIDTSLLSGQVQNLTKLFAPTANSSTNGVAGYQEFANVMVDEKPSQPTTEGVNQVAVQSLALVASAAAVAETLLVGGEKTRIEAINNANSVLDYFKFITDTLDSTQELYKNKDIDLQYFSQSSSYADAFNLATIAAVYKLRSAFDLAVEKRFILKKPWTPIMIVLDEYGDPERLDEFIELNELSGDDIWLLPAGREVVVYA